MKGLQYSMSRGAKAGDIVSPLNTRLVRRAVAITDVNGQAAWGTNPLVSLPLGNVLILGAVLYVKFTKNDADIVDAFDGDYSLGSAPSTSNAALATDKADIIASTAFGEAATAGVTPLFRAASAGALAGLILDNTAGTLEVNLNILLDDAAISADGSLYVEGSLHMLCAVLGDD